MKKFTPLILMAAIFVLSYGADLWLETARNRASQTFIMSSLVWLNAILTLLFAGAIIGLAWFVNVRNERDGMVSWIFLVIGVLILFLNPMQFTTGITVLPSWFLKLTPNSFLIRSGAFVAVTGIWDLIVRKPSRDY